MARRGVVLQEFVARRAFEAHEDPQAALVRVGLEDAAHRASLAVPDHRVSADLAVNPA